MEGTPTPLDSGPDSYFRPSNGTNTHNFGTGTVEKIKRIEAFDLSLVTPACPGTRIPPPAVYRSTGASLLKGLTLNATRR